MEWFSDPSPTSLDRVEKADLHRFILNAIGNLPRQQKAIVTLRVQEGMTYSEIAEILGRSVGNCKAAYHNAIVKLRGMFKNEAIL